MYILGYSSSSGATPFPVTASALQSTNFGSSEATFSKLSANGQSLLYSTYLGGSGADTDPIGNNGVKFNKCRIYLAISSGSDNFPLTDGAITTNINTGGIAQPVLLSFANPPDLTTYSLTPATQSIGCGATPADINAGATSYLIPNINRAGTSYSLGVTNAYPNYATQIAPGAAAYQWQRQVDGVNWTNIAGATGQNLTAAQIGTVVQDTRYRRLTGNTPDACNRPGDPIASITVVGDPTIAPTINCAGGNFTIAANATGTGTLSYAWTLPALSQRTAPVSTANSVTYTGTTDRDAGNYTITVTNAGGCKASSTFGFNTSSCALVALPVKLLSFSAARRGEDGLLTWAAASEVNADYYSIEHSMDGKEFTAISRVATNNSEAKTSYSFIHTAPGAGTHYYRLKMVDKNGDYTYSEIRILNFGEDAASILLYPNPVTNVAIITGVEAGAQLRLLALDGRTIMSKAADANTTTVDMNLLPSGIYLLQVLKDGGIISNTRVTKN